MEGAVEHYIGNGTNMFYSIPFRWTENSMSKHYCMGYVKSPWLPDQIDSFLDVKLLQSSVGL